MLINHLDILYFCKKKKIIHFFSLLQFITVIWNPWIDKARETPDFGDDEYPNMICVESGHVSSPVILLPGTAFEASQILQVIK
jgi:D-hexose-6-phosphate mutarotase